MSGPPRALLATHQGHVSDSFVQFLTHCEALASDPSARRARRVANTPHQRHPTESSRPVRTRLRPMVARRKAASDHFRGGYSSSQPEGQSQCCRAQSIRQRQPQHLIALSSQRHAHANLVSSLGHQVREDSIEAYSGQHERKNAKCQRQFCIETCICCGPANDLVHSQHMKNARSWSICATRF
jgi:hypothetical protein